MRPRGRKNAKWAIAGNALCYYLYSILSGNKILPHPTMPRVWMFQCVCLNFLSFSLVLKAYANWFPCIYTSSYSRNGRICRARRKCHSIRTFLIPSYILWLFNAITNYKLLLYSSAHSRMNNEHIHKIHLGIRGRMLIFLRIDNFLSNKICCLQHKSRDNMLPWGCVRGERGRETTKLNQEHIFIRRFGFNKSTRSANFTIKFMN